jgi:signal transduction histidine kinase
MAKVVVIQGQAEQRELLLGDQAVLGRAPECDVVISGPLVSRRHARITRADGGYYVEDMASANGTVVNGSNVSRMQLHDGDWISVGDCRLTFVLDDDYMPPHEALLLDDATATVVGMVDADQAALGDETTDSPVAFKLRARLEVLRDISERSCGALDIAALVELALGELLRVYSQADHAHAVLLGAGGSGADLRLSVTRAGRERARAGMSRTLFELAVTRGKAVLASDAQSDAQLASAQSIVGQNVRSTMCSPLLMGAKALGAIQVDTTSGGQPFTVDDLQLLVTIAGQVAIAAENARLHREIVARERLAAVGQAVASLAHCVKNTLNGLQGGAYILDLGIRKGEQEKVVKGWEMVKRNAGFMSDLVKDMLAYCRTGLLVRERTDLRPLLQETLALVEESAHAKGVATSLASEGEPVAEVDPTGIKRVVLNLLTNAIEACSAGCHVRVAVGADPQDRLVRIVVEDDGPGMTPEAQARLFEPFFTTKGSRGTGLGLALVKKVIEEHHGRVEVTSEPGHGAAVSMLIPAQSDEEETALS